MLSGLLFKKRQDYKDLKVNLPRVHKNPYLIFFNLLLRTADY